MELNPASLKLQNSLGANARITNAAQTGLNITSTISIMGYAYPTSMPSTTILVAKDNTGANGTRGYFLRQQNDGKLAFLFQDGAGNQTRMVTDNVVLATNSWTHYAMVISPSTQTGSFYTQGATVSSTVDQANASSINNSTASFAIGTIFSADAATQASAWDGLQDQITVWNKKLSFSEISANYNNGKGQILNGDESGLQGYWEANNNLNDKTSNANHLSFYNTDTASTATYSTNIPFGLALDKYDTKVVIQSGVSSNSTNKYDGKIIISDIQTNKYDNKCIIDNTNKEYSRENQTTLGSTDSNLSTLYTADDKTTVSTNNSTYVSIVGTTSFLVHEFREKGFTNNTKGIKSIVDLNATKSPITNTVSLQIFNQSSSNWETLSTNTVQSSSVDFNFNQVKSSNITEYYKESDTGSYYATFRIYQAL
jgi:hypothetical protein